jgi:TRAP-type C4-dicarboxylate transport system permease small subunit
MHLRRWTLHAVENLLIAGFVTMIVMVFGNVVLRYGFNSGIIVSEEISRMIFVWLTFGGAFLVAREGGHLGMSALVDKLGPKGKWVCQVLVEGATLFCMSLLVIGCWKQTAINMNNMAPASGLPVGITYMAGIACGLGIGALNVQNLIQLIFKGQLLSRPTSEIAEAPTPESIRPEEVK